MLLRISIPRVHLVWHPVSNYSQTRAFGEPTSNPRSQASHEGKSLPLLFVASVLGIVDEDPKYRIHIVMTGVYTYFLSIALEELSCFSSGNLLKFAKKYFTNRFL